MVWLPFVGLFILLGSLKKAKADSKLPAPIQNGKLTTAYDPIFKQYGAGIPVPFLRALAYKESGLNPLSANKGGESAAKGLMQVVGVVRKDYNDRHGTNITADDLFDPRVSVTLAADTLNRVISGYKKHPSKNLHVDWNNPEFIRLLVMGWNAGFSEGGGVGKVASYLESHDIPVTHENVFSHAKDVGAVKYLSMPERRKWHREVADLYMAQPDRKALS